MSEIIEPESQQLPSLRSSRSRSKLSGTIFSHLATESPGPCYDIRSASAFVQKALPQFSIRHRDAEHAANRVPGPNAYDVVPSKTARGGYVRQKGSTYLDSLIKGTNSLGPGQYSIEKRTVASRKIQGGTILNKQPIISHETRPSPNEYNISPTIASKATHMFVGDRDPFKPSSDQQRNPGPAKYQVNHKACKRQTPTLSFPVALTGSTSSQTTPGPNAYEIKTDATQHHTPSFSLRGREFCCSPLQ